MSGDPPEGGVTLRELADRPVSDLHGVGDKKATALAKKFWNALAVDGEDNWIITRGQFVINMRRFDNGDGRTPIQIVLRLYQSPAEGDANAELKRGTVLLLLLRSALYV